MSAWWSWPKFCYVYVYGEEEEGEFNQRAKQKNVKPQHPEILLVWWIEEEFLSQKVIIAPNFRWKWLPFYVDFGSRTVGSALQAVTQALQLVSGCPGCPHPGIWIKFWPYRFFLSLMDSFPKLSFLCLISVFEFGSHNILLNRWASPQGQEMLCGMRCVSPRETWISRYYHNRSREQHKLDCKDKHLQHFWFWIDKTCIL